MERGESPQAELGTPGLFRGSGFAACNCLLRHATMPLRSSLRCCLTRLARCPSWRSSSRWSRIYLAHVSRNEAPAQNPSRNSRIYDMPQRSSLRCCLIRLAKCLFWRSSSKWFKICLAHASRKGAPAWLAGQASGHRSQVMPHSTYWSRKCAWSPIAVVLLDTACKMPMVPFLAQMLPMVQCILGACSPQQIPCTEHWQANKRLCHAGRKYTNKPLSSVLQCCSTRRPSDYPGKAVSTCP